MTPRAALLALVMTVLACQLQAPHAVMAVMTPTPMPAPKPIRAVMTLYPGTARVIAIQSLNVRQAPGHDNPVIGALYHGNTVVMTGKCHAGWAEIRWKSSTAYVNARYLSGDPC